MTLPADDVRQRAIEVANALLAEGGVAAVKARTVAAAVGVSVGSVYNLHGSINGLIQAANAEVLSRFGMALQEALAGVPDGADLETRLLVMAEAYLDFMQANGRRWSALLEYNRDREVDVLVEDYAAQETALLTALADGLRGTALDDGDAERGGAARMLWSAMHGIVSLNYLGFEDAAARERTWALARRFVSLVVRGAGARPV